MADDGEFTLDKFEFNDEAAQAILKSATVQNLLMSRAQPIKATADSTGGTHRIVSGVGVTRTHVRVFTGDYEARKTEATDRNLTRALDAGRD